MDDFYHRRCDRHCADDGTWCLEGDAARSSPAWKAAWFLIARRFFLYGGNKEFNPKIGEVDRIVDYVTALEAVLTPEHDFLGKRISRRAAALLTSDATEQSGWSQLVKELYNVRSTIVHGSELSTSTIDWLVTHRNDIESLVRGVLVSSVKTVPPDDKSRRTFLSSLFDITDLDRSTAVQSSFAAIKDKSTRTDCATKIIEKVAKGMKPKAALIIPIE
jgi:hypothetical protein